MCCLSVTLLLDPKRDSLLSGTSAVLLAERVKDEFEASPHKCTHKVSNVPINGMPLCTTGISKVPARCRVKVALRHTYVTLTLHCHKCHRISPDFGPGSS